MWNIQKNTSSGYRMHKTELNNDIMSNAMRHCCKAIVFFRTQKVMWDTQGISVIQCVYVCNMLAMYNFIDERYIIYIHT